MDSNSQITGVNNAVNNFFDQQTPKKTMLNLQSVLQKAMSSSDEALNDPIYRAEMLETIHVTTNFILELSLICGKDVLKE